MTISTTDNRKTYAGNGVTTGFAFPYLFFADSDLVVSITVDATGVSTTQVLNTDYTVTGEGTETSGQVSMVTAPASGETLVIYRNVPLTQETDYITGDAFPSETHENALDKLTIINQQQQDQISRTFKLPDSYPGSASTELPAPQAGKGVRWNDTGDALENTVDDLDDLITGSAANAAAAAASEANAAISESNAANSETNADLERQYAAEWANKAEDSLISSAAGGDQVDDYSALHWANKAAASAASIPVDVLVDSDIGSIVQAYDVDTAKTDVAQNFTASQRSPFIVDNDGSFDQNAGQNFKCTPTGPVTITFTNIANGQSGSIWFDNSAGVVASKAGTTLMDDNLLTTISSAGIYILGYESD